MFHWAAFLSIEYSMLIGSASRFWSKVSHMNSTCGPFAPPAPTRTPVSFRNGAVLSYTT